MDPLNPRPDKRKRVHPGIIALWIVAALIFIGAIALVAHGERVRGELSERSQQG